MYPFMTRFWSFDGYIVFPIMCNIAHIEPFLQIWSRMAATFSLCILSGPSGTHKLKAFSLKQGLMFPSFASVTCRREYCRPTTSWIFYNLLTNSFCFFKNIGPFLFCEISESGCLTFNVLSFFWYLHSVKQLWGPLEATFSSWILSSGLHCTRKLRASLWSIKTALSIICKLCFWKATLSDNLILDSRFFYPFDLLVEEVQNWKLSLLMSKDSGEKFIKIILLSDSKSALIFLR